MATTTSITTTYAGENKGKIISAALLSGNTLSNGGFQIRPNITSREVVRRLETDGLIKGGTCDFEDTSTVTSTERYLDPKELQVNLKLCKKDWVADWDGKRMGYSAHRNGLPDNIQDYLVQYVAAKVAESIEIMIWQGVDDADNFDGIETLLAADATIPAAQKIAGTTIDASNVLEELEKVYVAIPNELYGKSDLYMYVSQNVYKSYAIALGGFAANGQGANGINAQGLNQGFQGLQYAGVKLFMCNGMSNDVIIAAEQSNLWFGTGIMADWNEVKLIDTAATLGDQNVRVVMRFLGAVQYGVSEDIVTYGIA
ncbi:MAG: hypothetical protein HRU18_11100 [Pseudoalteromonas sp.]|uniref:hypothetical protein n=1 Tax=Pseudoalteromonas sp. TaxID=53249 RepID=UPI001D4453BE|nr:hypothetical protein [Pseudoalteromonas sp.]NRA78746.1 hypothetical protein [Pseudoalteromonas sp.]